MILVLATFFALLISNYGLSGTLALPSLAGIASDLVTELLPSDQTSESTVEESLKPWACDVRAWVRAPDLFPGSVYPAEARLTTNGSECKDILGWEVGLRFKERAIVKLKAKEIDHFPNKPGWNFSHENERMDWNDIYSAGYFGRSSDREREDRMLEYTRAIQNKSLWEVHGAERIVFDIKQALPLAWSTDQVGGSFLVDKVESFAVHMPNTNFPPIHANHFDMSMNGDAQMVRSETQLEYYHSIHLANGSTLDIPAGRAGFLPSPESVAHLPLGEEGGLLSKVPRVVQLDSPRLKEEKVDDEMWRDTRPLAPECDEGNLAQFKIEIQPLLQAPTQGRNTTFNLTLTRTGNGTEQPVFLDIGHRTLTNYTFARLYTRSEDEYENLVNPPNRGYTIYLDSQTAPMLMVKNEEALVKEKERTVASGNIYISRKMGQPRAGYARHVFEEGEEREVWQIQLEMPIAYNDMPTFQTTFHTYRSALDIKLQTTYTCLNPPKPKGSNSNAEDADADADADEALRKASKEADEAWTPYRLPVPPQKERVRTVAPSHRAEPHVATVLLDVVPSSSSFSGTASPSALALQAAAEAAVHYLDPRSLAPVLSRSEIDTVHHPLLDQSIRDEEEHEQRRSRYVATERDQRQYKLPGNSGGAWMHAAALWQRKERGGREADGDGEVRVEDKPGDSGSEEGMVLQFFPA